MEFFEGAYRGNPPWEMGRPQPEFVQLEKHGEIRGRVLDVGCGTGENALMYAAAGHDTWGIDFAPTAIRRASDKALARKSSVHFEVASALELGRLGERFDTVTDCGMFHTLLDEHRPVYASSVASVLRPRGRLFILCFSEREPKDWGGPRRVTEAEIRGTFAAGWKARWIREGRFETRFEDVTGYAWMAALEKAGSGPGRGRSTASSGPASPPLGRDA